MIARVWRGVIRAGHVEEYIKYIEQSVLYPEDEHYLLEPSTITHYEIAE